MINEKDYESSSRLTDNVVVNNEHTQFNMSQNDIIYRPNIVNKDLYSDIPELKLDS